MRAEREVADVLRVLGDGIEGLGFSKVALRHLRAIRDCRTSVLGGHIDKCNDCQSVHISYNSCRNRHCPKCQGHKRHAWMQARIKELLPVPYFHVVFTLPQELCPLALHAPRMVYKALFDACWQTMAQFCRGKGLLGGMVAILHTWGQNLSLHPHLHCIVPGGGVDAHGQWKGLRADGKFLFPVKALSKVFRAKYISLLRGAGHQDQPLFDVLFAKEWVVYAKRPFGSAHSVIEYLGRYTNKVAISNHRILSVDSDWVSFSYKDYRDAGKTKEMRLTPHEFVRRYAQHLLPKGFTRIRHYGYLSSAWKCAKLPALQKALAYAPPQPPEPTKLRRCPCCKTGQLATIAVFGSRGPPLHNIAAPTLTAC